MPYGFSADNADGRSQISSEETYGHLVLREEGVMSPGDFNSRGIGPDLFFASGSSGGRMGMDSSGVFYSPYSANSTTWFTMSQYGVNETEYSNYGLQVKNPSNQITYDSRYSETSFSIIATGVLPAGGSQTSIYIDYGNSGFSTGEVYCLLNGTTLDEQPGEFAIRTCYTHQGSLDRVKVENYATGNIDTGFGDVVVGPLANRDMTYLIVGRRG